MQERDLIAGVLAQHLKSKYHCLTAISEVTNSQTIKVTVRASVSQYNPYLYFLLRIDKIILHLSSSETFDEKLEYFYEDPNFLEQIFDLISKLTLTRRNKYYGTGIRRIAN